MSENSIEEILKHYESPYYSGASSHLKLQAQLTAACTKEIGSKVEDLTRQLNENASASDRLGEKVLWLNRILTLATIAGACATIVLAYDALN